MGSWVVANASEGCPWQRHVPGGDKSLVETSPWWLPGGSLVAEAQLAGCAQGRTRGPWEISTFCSAFL